MRALRCLLSMILMPSIWLKLTHKTQHSQTFSGMNSLTARDMPPSPLPLAGNSRDLLHASCCPLWFFFFVIIHFGFSA